MSSEAQPRRILPDWWTARDTVLVAVAGLAALWLGSGFLHPDPHLNNWEIRHSRLFVNLLRWGIYLGFALSIWFGAGLYFALRSGKLRVQTCAALLALAAVVALVCYLPLSLLYEARMRPHAQVHPYLQLFPPPAEDAPDEAVHVVCLGGSTTAFPDEKGRRWTDLVEARLTQQHPSLTFKVQNQGREYYTSMHSLINYEVNVRKTHPDIIIVMHGINDLMQNADHSYYASGEFRPDYGHHFGPLARVNRTRNLASFSVEVLRGIWNWKPREVVEIKEFPGKASFEANLSRLVQLGRLDGSQVILMTQPTLYKDTMTPEEADTIWMHTHNGVGERARWNIQTPLNGMRQYTECVRNIARDQSVPLIDLEQAVPKDLEHLSDDCHYRSPAIELIAEQVTNALKSQLPDAAREKLTGAR